jgi:hypothetical protein
MVVFCFSCGTPCKSQKGLKNHVKSCPKCLHDLGIARAVSIGLSPSSSSSQPINHHSFQFETDPNLAAKRSVEVMWHDENAFEAASSIPESPSKFRKGSSAASKLRASGNSSVYIEHRCGTKNIDMLSAADDASRPLQDVLMDKLPAASPPTPALSLFEIERMQSSMKSAIVDFYSDDDDSIFSGEVEDSMVPPPLEDSDLPNEDVNV